MPRASSSLYGDRIYERARKRLLRVLERSGKDWLLRGELSLGPDHAAKQLVGAAELLVDALLEQLGGEPQPTMGAGVIALEKLKDLDPEIRKGLRRISPYLWYVTNVRNLQAHQGDTVERDDVVELMRQLERVFAWFSDAVPQQREAGRFHVAVPSVERFRDASGQWHVLPSAVATLARTLRDAYRAGDATILEKCLSPDFEGDLYGAKSRAALLDEILGFQRSQSGSWELDVRIGTCMADAAGRLAWEVVFEVRDGASIVEDAVSYVSLIDLDKPMARVQSLRGLKRLRRMIPE